jgi:hypothetical protein
VGSQEFSGNKQGTGSAFKEPLALGLEHSIARILDAHMLTELVFIHLSFYDSN